MQKAMIMLRGDLKHGTINRTAAFYDRSIQMKLITIDLDGTLLGTDGKISPANVKAIQKAEEAGYKVSISTGRSRHDTEEILKQAALKLPITTGNGEKHTKRMSDCFHLRSPMAWFTRLSNC